MAILRAESTSGSRMIEALNKRVGYAKTFHGCLQFGGVSPSVLG